MKDDNEEEPPEEKEEPEYDFDEFVKACEDHSLVNIEPDAEDDASQDLKLHNANQIRDFICSGGINDKDWQDTKLLRSNKRHPPRYTDAYGFRSRGGYFYISFFIGHIGKWVVKSLKLNINTDPQKNIKARKGRRKIVR